MENIAQLLRGNNEVAIISTRESDEQFANLLDRQEREQQDINKIDRAITEKDVEIMTFIPPTVSLEGEIIETNKQDKENFIPTKLEIEETNLDAIEKSDREDKERLIRKIVDPAEGLTVNDQLTSQDLNLLESLIASPLQLPPELNAIVEDITRNVMEKITQQSIINPPEMIVVDPDIPQGSDTETIDYI